MLKWYCCICCEYFDDPKWLLGRPHCPYCAHGTTEPDENLEVSMDVYMEKQGTKPKIEMTSNEDPERYLSITRDKIKALKAKKESLEVEVARIERKLFDLNVSIKTFNHVNIKVD